MSGGIRGASAPSGGGNFRAATFPALRPRETMDIISLWRSSGAQPRRKAGDNPFYGYEVLHSGENDKSEDDKDADNQNDSESHDSFLPQCVWQP